MVPICTSKFEEMEKLGEKKIPGFHPDVEFRQHGVRGRGERAPSSPAPAPPLLCSNPFQESLTT